MSQDAFSRFIKTVFSFSMPPWIIIHIVLPIFFKEPYSIEKLTTGFLSWMVFGILMTLFISLLKIASKK